MSLAILDGRPRSEGVRRSCGKWGQQVTPEGPQWECGSARCEWSVGSEQQLRADLREMVWQQTEHAEVVRDPVMAV